MYSLYLLKKFKGPFVCWGNSRSKKQSRTPQKRGGAEFTYRNKVNEVVYTESFSTLLEPRRRETQIKGWRREKKENLIKFGKPIKT